MDASKIQVRSENQDREAALDVARGGLAPWQVRMVEAHVDGNLDRNISVEELAALARLSVSHFGRAFKQSFGVAPHAYITAERMALARDLMLTTSEPLSQIALTVGLADQSHLSRLFRQHVGESPLAWRRARWTPNLAGIAVQ
jgi:AraC family transcriptional regulator